MMKNLLITLFTALMFSASFGQVSPTLTSPTTPGGTVTATNIDFTINIVNTSMTTIPAGDTIWYWFRINGGGFNSFTGTPGQVSGALVAAGGLAPGASITRSFGPASFVSAPTTATITRVCTYATVGINNVSANSDSSCYDINRSLLSIEDNTLDNRTKVFAANNEINMSATSNENLTYAVISITGQTISTGNFVNNKRVDMSGVAKGIYAVVITNGSEKVTKKVAIH